MRRPSLVLRPNRLRTRPAALLADLAAANMTCRLDADGSAIEVLDGAGLFTSTAFAAGLFQPQDATAQAVWQLCPPTPGGFLIDLCAGVGTKATHAAELMDNRGIVLAADIDEARLSAIEANARRLGISIVQTVASSGLDAELARIGRIPDAVLVDAPCSGSGVFARRPEARYRLSAASLARLCATQAELLARASRLCGPATNLIYSTCSIEREENEDQIAAFLGRHPGWRAGPQRLTLPSAGDQTTLAHDGGFAAVALPPA